MLYQPKAFREDDVGALHALIRREKLAMVVSNGPDGAPDITHLPLLLDPDVGPAGMLIGHFARANPHAARLGAAGRAVAVFRGGDAYVSPNWYASKAEHHRVVPTWNYEAVHAEGRVELVDDLERLRQIVDALTDAQEQGQPRPWSVADAPAPFVAGQLTGIIGVLLYIERLDGKRKLSQNRAARDREGVIAGLERSERPLDHAVAAAMARDAEG